MMTTTPRTPPKLTVEDGINEITTSTNGLSLQNPIGFITANVVTPPPPLPTRRSSQKGPWNTHHRDGNQRRYNHHQNHSSQRPHRHDGRYRLAQHDTRGCDDTKDPRRGSEDRTQRITVKAIQRGSGRNTESFDPVSTLVRPDLRVQVGSPRSTRFTKKLKHDDVVIVPELFGPENDWTLFHKLYEEIVNLQKHHVRGSDWISWHEGAHLIVRRPEESPTFQSVIHRLCEYFNIRKESIGTRFNYYKDSQDWKPFHHDSAAFNAERAQNQNITVGVSFGATRELAFLHATQSTNNANTHGQDDNNEKEEDSPRNDENRKIRVYFPQPNNGVFSFGRDVNIRWKHGINALPTTEQDGKGRISIILWGLAQDVIEEPHSPPMISTSIPGPHGASMPQSKKKKIRDNQNKHRDNSLQNTA